MTIPPAVPTARFPWVVCQMEERRTETMVNAILEVSASTGTNSYCGGGRNASADVLIYANSGDARAFNDDITPTLSRFWQPGLGYLAASTTLRVMCP